MSNRRIRQLDSISGVDVASDDLFIAWDDSAADTKNITRTELVGALFKDEDDMASNSATHGATQQSVAAFLDTKPAMEFIEVQVLDDDTYVDFTAFDATRYAAYFFEFIAIKSTVNMNVNYVTSSDGGTTFDEGTSDYSYLWSWHYDNTTVSDVYQASFPRGYAAGGAGTATGEGTSGDLWIFGPEKTAYTSLYSRSVGRYGTYSTQGSTWRVVRRDADVVDAIRFFYNAANLLSGSIRMYGLRK